VVHVSPTGAAEHGSQDSAAARRAGVWNAAFVTAMVAALALASIAGPRTFGTNDNIGVIENAVAGHPTPYCAFATTSVLHQLYARWPAVPWFPVDILCALLAAAAVMAFLATRVHADRASRLAAAAVVGCLFSPFVLRLDYNSSSILLGASAVLLLAFAPGGRLGTGRMVLVAALCLWSYSLRRMGFFGAACLLSPFAMLGLARAGPAAWMRAGIVAAAVGALVWADGAAYRANFSDSYRQFAEFNDVRKSLHNSAYVASGVVDPRALSATGWTANDYWLFSNWFYLDEGRFNVRSVGALRAFVHDEAPLPPSLPTGLALAWRDYRFDYAVLGVALALSVLWRRGRRPGPLVLAAGAFVAGTVMMETYWEFPLHVGIPFIVAASAAVLAVPLPKGAGPVSGLRPGVALLAAVVAFLGLASFVRDRRENAAHNVAFSRTIERIESLPPGSVLLLEGGALRLDWSDPFHPPEPRQSLIRTGMGIYSPLFYENLNTIGLRRASEVLPFLAGSGRGYLVAHDDSVPHLVQFAREAYGIGIAAVPVDTLESGARIYRITPDASPH
jgi:hypothetical protein